MVRALSDESDERSFYRLGMSAGTTNGDNLSMTFGTGRLSMEGKNPQWR
jgi:hypothetical protein